jgi:hypothetical protein
MPLIADNIVVFLWRTFMRWFLEFRCRNWAQIDGVVSSVQIDQGMYPFVKIRYKYRVRDSRHAGSYLNGFWYSGSARDFGNGFRGGDRIRIRYSLQDPAKSYILMNDQTVYLMDLAK